MSRSVNDTVGLYCDFCASLENDKSCIHDDQCKSEW